MLRLLAIIYGKVVGLRNRLYSRGVLDTFDLGARTISVGNITTGGTGKTPLVEYIAAELIARGERVCILTRGYGREDQRKRVVVADGVTILADAAVGGDEPVELAAKLNGQAIIIADADRVAAAEWALRKFAPTVFILDDGFQHRRVRRHLDIVCIDTDDPFGRGHMLPAGCLREPVENLKRADVVILMSGQKRLERESLRRDIRQLVPDAAIFDAERVMNGLTPISGGTDDTQVDPSTACFGFCGLANPSQFFNSLAHEGLNIVGTLPFHDHHKYLQKDVDEIETTARAAGAEILLTTRKDAVKLHDIRLEMSCYVVEIKLAIDKPEDLCKLL